MTLLHKIGACLLAGLLLFGAGWFSRGKEIQTVQLPPKVVTQIQTQVVEHTVTKVVTKTVKDPKSGAVTTTVTKEVEANSTKDKDREVSKTAAQPVAPVGKADPNWGLALSWTPRLSPAAEYPTEVEVSRRVLGPAWLTAGFDWNQHAAKVGVRVEF